MSDGKNPEIDSIILSHHRKMQRRQANRRSAQLSRARKKAHLEELKIENQRLQHICDILDSQPEFIFAFNRKGNITYMPERLKLSIKSAQISNLHLSGEELKELDEEDNKDISHVTQILTPESVNILFESIKELDGTASNASYVTSSHLATYVKEVYYQDATGFPVAGFMRCSRLTLKGTNGGSNGKATIGDIHANEVIGNADGHNSDTNSNKNEKKRRKTERSSHCISQFCNIQRSQTYGNNSNSSSDHTSTHSSNISNGSDYGGTTIKVEHGDADNDSYVDSSEEFIAVIRPVSSSTPYGTNNLHLLSAASMVTHNEYSSDTSSGKDIKHEYSSLTSGERTTQSSHGSSDEGSSTNS